MISDLIQVLNLDYILLNKLTSEVKGLKTTYKKSNISLYELIKRPDFSYQDLKQYIEAYELDDFWQEKINIKIKYMLVK